MLIQELEPDYVLAVKFQNGDKATSDGDKKLQLLLDTLDKKGFKTAARPGPNPNESVLIFVRLASSAYVDLAEKDLVKNYEFGVTSKGDSADRARLIWQYLNSPEVCGGAGITPGKGNWSFVTSITPISGYLSDKSLAANAQKVLLTPELETLSIKENHGVQIALYFEFLKFYIGGLAVLSIFGIVAHVKSKNYSLTYSFVNLIWGTLFLLLWKRRERYLVNFWGVQNVHRVDKYNADLTTLNAKTSSYKHRDGNEGKRFVRQVAFAPVALAFVGVLVSYQLSCFVLEIFLTEIYDGPGKMFVGLLPTILLSVFVPVLTLVYNIVVDKFLTWEGHENDYTRTDSYVVKTFVLNFLTGYVPLLITSFIYLPFAHLIEPNLVNIRDTIANNINSDRYMYKYLTKVKSQQEFKINQERLNGQFFFFIVTGLVVQLVMKYALPLILGPVIAFVTAQISGKKEEVEAKEDPAEKAWLDKVLKAVQLPEYDVGDDYRGITMQYGYLIMFGPVWTLAPLFSLVFNVVTFKLDKLKLSNGMYFRPPTPKRVDSIHPWDHAFFLLTWIGSVISPIVTAFYRHGTKPPKPLGQFAFDKASVNVSSTVLLFLVFFFSEHLFFTLYFVGSKISHFLKSEKEIENDFIDNDIKLRRDYFSSEVKAKISPPNDGAWGNSSAASTLKQAKGLNLVEPTESTGALSSFSKGAGASTLSNRGDSVLEQKKKELKAKQDELESRKQLEAFKDKEDIIVNTVDQDGKPSLAIMDNNEHISEKDSESIRKLVGGLDAEKDSESFRKLVGGLDAEKDSDSIRKLVVGLDAEKATTESAEVADDAESQSDISTSQSASQETATKSKKRGLKKLLKRK